MQLAECVAHVETELGHTLPASFVADFRAQTARRFYRRLRTFPGVVDFIQTLEVPICVASNGPREKIELGLRLTGLLPFFSGRLFSAYEVGAWKPDPAVFLYAAQSIGIEPANCLVIEDSLPGIHAGLAAGMKVFAFQPYPTDARIPKAVGVFKRFCDLREMIEGAEH